MEIRVSENNIQIVNSYEVSKKRFDAIIDRLQRNLPQHKVIVNRSRSSIKKEWTSHNLLYKLGIARSRTRDLDINYPLTFVEEVFYSIVGTLGSVFIS